MISKYTRGLDGAAPWAVALVRGVLEAAVMAGLGALALFLTSSPPAAIVPFAPFGLVVIRVLEGLADNIDPAKQRAPDAP